MSTPIEVYDDETGDSVHIDEYGVVSIRVSDNCGKWQSVELTLPSVLEVIRLLVVAAQKLQEKEEEKSAILDR